MNKKCHFCNEERKSKIAIPSVGIALGMSGFIYCFCITCLKKRTAYEFFQLLAEESNYTFPLRYKNGTG